MTRKIALISDARTSHGIYTPVLDAIEKDSELDYIYIICGMHLSEKFGHTIDIIRNEGYKTTTMNVLPEGNNGSDQARFIAKATIGLIELFEQEKPDIILAQGDRGITVAAAIAGAHMGIPVAHMHGGEISGTIDESARHAITKYSHMHFPASQESAERITKLGEEQWRIHLVGAAGIQLIIRQAENLLSKEETAKIFGYNPDKPVIVVLQHPVTDESANSGKQMRATMQAIEELGEQTIVIYPNSDAGREEMIKEVEESVLKNKNPDNPNRFFIKSFPSVPYKQYLSLLKHASVMVGNSSGGIIEAPSLGLPVINIGTRQQGRERAKNIIDVGYDKDEILSAIRKAINDESFKAIVGGKETPYDPCGDGKIAERMCQVMKEVEINEKLIDKKLTY